MVLIRWTLKRVYQQLPKLYDDQGNRVAQDKKGKKKTVGVALGGGVGNTGTFEQRLGELYFEKYLVFQYLAEQRDQVVHTLSATEMQNLTIPHQNGKYSTQELAGLTASGTRQSVVLSARGVMQNYHEALDELKIVARAYLLNEDVTKLGVADTLEGKLISGFNELLSSSLEGLLESTVGVHIASDQDLVSAFVANMQNANIPLSDEQLKDAKASLPNKIGQSVGQSIPVMFEIAFTSAITGALGEVKAIAQASKAVFNTLKYMWGSKGEKAYKVFASMFKGAVSYGMAGQSTAAGAGEGMVQSLINEDVLNKLKGKFGVFFTFGLRVMAGTTTETLQEYAGNFADNLVQTNFNWGEACKATFGASFGEATDRLLVTAITSALFSGAFNAGTLAGKSNASSVMVDYKSNIEALEANSQALKTAKAYALEVIDAALGKAGGQTNTPTKTQQLPTTTKKQTKVQAKADEVKKFKTEEEQRLGVFIRQKDGKRFIRVLHSLATATDVANQVKANVVLTHEAAHAFVDDMSAVEKQAFLDAIYLASAQAGTGAFDPDLMEELAVEYIAQQYVKQQVETNATLARAKAATLLQQFKQFLRKLAAQLRNGIRGMGFVSTEGQVKNVLEEMMGGFIKQNKLNPEQLAQFDYLDNFNTWLHSPAKNQTSKKGEEVKKFTYGGYKATTGWGNKKEKSEKRTLLKKAVNMWASKRFTEKKIWQETGWFRGKEGLWRFEIDDSTAKLDIDRMTRLNEKNTQNKSIKLTKILNHPELYKNYPILKKINVELGTSNQANLDKNRIELDFNNIGNVDKYSKIEGNPTTFEEKVKSILLHEIQHLIQHHEGFAQGGNAYFFANFPIDYRLSRVDRSFSPLNSSQIPANQVLNKIEENVGIKIRALADTSQNKLLKDIWEKIVRQGIVGLTPQEQSIFMKYYHDSTYDNIWKEHKNFQSLSIIQLYELLVGEAESRDVQWRMFLNEQERKARLPLTDLTSSEGYSLDFLMQRGDKSKELPNLLKKISKLLKDKNINIATGEKIK